MKNNGIYLDSAASSQMHPEVIDTMMSVMRNNYANSSSVHSAGQSAAAAAEHARDICAEAVGAEPNQIIFTSGGTESINIALLGCARAGKQKGRHLITTNIEHSAVLNTFRRLESEGFEITYISASSDGLISAEDIRKAVREDTVLISVMHVNNEIGTIQPIEAAGRIAKERNIIFHTDAVQSFGKIRFNASQINADLISVSAHKLHGPKGAGFLYAASAAGLEAVMFGGSQQKGLRPGTLDTPAAAGFGKSIEIALRDMDETEKKIKALRDLMISRIESEIEGAHLNGSRVHRISENINFSFEGITSDRLLYSLDSRGVYISSGSACEAGSIETSHVIKAVGSESFGASARFTLSRFTSEDEIHAAVDILKKVLAEQRK